MRTSTVPFDATTARALNRLGAIGETRLEGQRGYVGQRLDLGYRPCWCGLMPAEHRPEMRHSVGASLTCDECIVDRLLYGNSFHTTDGKHIPADTVIMSIRSCCSECADTGLTFDDEDRPIPCERCA